jgi:hypothetical protein
MNLAANAPAKTTLQIPADSTVTITPNGPPYLLPFHATSVLSADGRVEVHALYPPRSPHSPAPASPASLKPPTQHSSEGVMVWQPAGPSTVIALPNAAGVTVVEASPSVLAVDPCTHKLQVHAGKLRRQMMSDLLKTEGSPWQRWGCWRRLGHDVTELRAVLLTLGYSEAAVPPQLDAFTAAAKCLEEAHNAWADALRNWAHATLEPGCWMGTAGWGPPNTVN